MDDKYALYAKLRQLPWPKKTIIFAHMPKTAGISFNTVIKKQYGVKRLLELNPKKSLGMLIMML